METQQVKQSDAYDRSLRAIGQVLETHQLNAFDLTRKDQFYLVRGQPEGGTVLQALLWKWQGSVRKGKGSFEQKYDSQDVELLQRQGRAKRQGGRRLPDFYRLPNVLRTVGAYLDMKDARLLQISKLNLNLTILYETKEGHPEVEERTIASFYNLFLHLHQRRRRLDQT
jgi:hypothetical protein